MNTKKINFSALVFSLMLSPATLLAQAEPGSVPVEPNQTDNERLSEAEALALDGLAYAERYGVSAEEGMRRIVVMVRASHDMANSVGIDEANISGVYFTHGSDFGLKVRTTGESAPADKQVSQPSSPGRAIASTKASPRGKALGLTQALVQMAGSIQGSEQTLSIKYQAQGKAPRKNIREVISQQYEAIKAALPTLDGIGYDEARGVVVAQVLQADSGKEIPANITARFPVPVETEIVSGRTVKTAARGGTRLVWGGTSDLNCTAAFIGKNPSGKLGILTAGHCVTDPSWTGGYDYIDGTTRHRLTIDNTSLNDNNAADWVYLGLPAALAAVPEFYGNLNESARSLTGRRTLSSTNAKVTDGVSQGTVVCAYGMRTGVVHGQTCGEVTYRSFSWGGGSGYFVQVEGSVTCNYGDSGSPVFTWNTAFGIVSGCGNPSMTKGAGVRFTYTSTDAVYAAGYSLAY